VLSGQENEAELPAAATNAVTAATGKQPVIYGAELAIGDQSMTALGETHSKLMTEARKAQASRAIVSLSWHPVRPTDNAVASGHGQLTNYEWNDLLTPGSELNQRWCGQVDRAALALSELQKDGIAVLWNPLPEANGKDFWWAGRKGVRGSAELYRQLFDRLVNQHKLHNLIWVWEADPPDFKPDGAGTPSDYFPGLLYADAIELRLSWLDARFPAGMVAQGAVGKPAGVEFTGTLPPPEVLMNHAAFAWFLATPQADPAARADAWRKLMGDPRVATLAPAQ
jgi:mannan endo-1,4-beta-mannosidase